MPAQPLDDAARRALIAAALERLRRYYVFPERGEEVAAAIEARLAAGEYDACGEAAALCAALTEHLRALTKDKHLRLAFHEEPKPPRDNLYEDPEELAAYFAEAALDNYGLYKAER